MTLTCNKEGVIFRTNLKTPEKFSPLQKESQIIRNLILCSRCATVRACVCGHSKHITTENKRLSSASEQHNHYTITITREVFDSE